MNILIDLLQRCHQRHEKPLRQQKTVAMPSTYTKGYVYQYTVYCAHSYPVRLDDIEAAEISFMPIGRAPAYDNGPSSFDSDRFLERQVRHSWGTNLWDASWGIQVYTGIPSQRHGARWHDLHFTYKAISAVPDTVFSCVLRHSSVLPVNPLLTMTKSGGLRFSCRVPDYLHPDTRDARETYTSINTHRQQKITNQQDTYLEIICAEKGYTRWDARYEILLGNLLEPPIIPKEVLFAPIDALTRCSSRTRTAWRRWARSYHPYATIFGVVSTESRKRCVCQARVLLYPARKRFSLLERARAGKRGRRACVAVGKRIGPCGSSASTPDAGLPIEARPITDVWNDTGILPTVLCRWTFCL